MENFRKTHSSLLKVAFMKLTRGTHIRPDIGRGKRNFQEATYLWNTRLRGALNVNVILIPELMIS